MTRPLLDAAGRPVLLMGYPVVLVDDADIPDTVGVVFGSPLVLPLPRRRFVIAGPPAPDHPPRDLP